MLGRRHNTMGQTNVVGEGEMLSGLLGSFVWVAANFAYWSHVRDRERGFKRFAAFWLGFPITLVSMFVAPRTKRVQARQQTEFDEEHGLLLEIRRDRARRDERARIPGHHDPGPE